MKRRYLFIIFSISIVLFTFFSCNKDPSTPQITTHTVTYKITANSYNALSYITYADTSGSPATASAADSTSGWSKTITISSIPFTAQF